MMFSGFDDGQAVARLRATEVQDRGDVFLDFDHPERTEVQECSVQPAQGSELLQAGRDATSTVLSVLDFEHETGFWESTDRVEINGEVYQIIGSPMEWPSPSGGLSHTQLLVNRWEG